MLLPIETPSLFGEATYPEALEFMKKQQDIFWFAEEIPVDKDIHDFRTNMTENQFRLSSITLDSFVEIEQRVGDVWEQIASWYPHASIQGACTQIAAMEKSVHAFFYQKMSDEMNIPPEVTAANQSEISVLRNKLSLISEITSNLSFDKLLSLATVAIIEQVLLFSNFAMLKSFQANGNNLIANTVTGVDFVVQDETIHGELAAYLHNTVLAESTVINTAHDHQVHNLIREVIAHEDAIIDYVFKGVQSINDITPAQLKAFVRSRADLVLTSLHIPTMYDITSNPIESWFYKSAKSIKIHDFFVAGTSQYRRGWKEANLTRKPFLQGVANVNIN